MMRVTRIGSIRYEAGNISFEGFSLEGETDQQGKSAAFLREACILMLDAMTQDVKRQLSEAEFEGSFAIVDSDKGEQA
jgi:hypothetical protein